MSLLLLAVLWISLKFLGGITTIYEFSMRFTKNSSILSVPSGLIDSQLPFDFSYLFNEMAILSKVRTGFEPPFTTNPLFFKIFGDAFRADYINKPFHFSIS